MANYDKGLSNVLRFQSGGITPTAFSAANAQRMMEEAARAKRAVPSYLREGVPYSSDYGLPAAISQLAKSFDKGELGRDSVGWGSPGLNALVPSPYTGGPGIRMPLALAAQSPDNPMLTQAMQERTVLDKAIAAKKAAEEAATSTPPDIQPPPKSLSEEYAELIKQFGADKSISPEVEKFNWGPELIKAGAAGIGLKGPPGSGLGKILSSLGESLSEHDNYKRGIAAAALAANREDQSGIKKAVISALLGSRSMEKEYGLRTSLELMKAKYAGTGTIDAKERASIQKSIFLDLLKDANVQDLEEGASADAALRALELQAKQIADRLISSALGDQASLGQIIPPEPTA